MELQYFYCLNYLVSGSCSSSGVTMTEELFLWSLTEQVPRNTLIRMRVETGPVSGIISLLTKTRNQVILHAIYCCHYRTQLIVFSVMLQELMNAIS